MPSRTASETLFYQSKWIQHRQQRLLQTNNRNSAKKCASHATTWTCSTYCQREVCKREQKRGEKPRWDWELNALRQAGCRCSSIPAQDMGMMPWEAPSSDTGSWGRSVALGLCVTDHHQTFAHPSGSQQGLQTLSKSLHSAQIQHDLMQASATHCTPQRAAVTAAAAAHGAQQAHSTALTPPIQLAHAFLFPAGKTIPNVPWRCSPSQQKCRWHTACKLRKHKFNAGLLLPEKHF